MDFVIGCNLVVKLIFFDSYDMVWGKLLFNVRGEEINVIFMFRFKGKMEIIMFFFRMRVLVWFLLEGIYFIKYCCSFLLVR